MELPSISYQQLRELPPEVFSRVIDVRSPQEFSEDQLPGAENLPLFDDDQRCLVGTLYKKDSPAAAYEQGLEYARQRTGGILAAVLHREIDPQEWQSEFEALAPQVSALSLAPSAKFKLSERELIVVHCWRGGMRSRSLVALLRVLGHKQVVCLEGGYKNYRAWVRQELDFIDPKVETIVLRGPTGVGKTQILQQLEGQRKNSCIDLEACAGHRSSVLGAVGLKPVSQKKFESRLAARMRELATTPCFVEGESRKVGNVTIPEKLFAAMNNGHQVHLRASLSHRCDVLARDYLATPKHIAELREQLPFLEKRLGGSWVGRLQEWLDAGEWRQVAEALLDNYYDPLYGHSDDDRNWALKLDAEKKDLISELLSFQSLCLR